MDGPFRADVAIYNASAYRAAHSAWESKWLSLEHDTNDEWFFRGFTQLTATVRHVRDGNDSGVVGPARNAWECLDGLADDYRSADLAGVRESLIHLEADPGVAADPPVLRLDDRVVTYDDFDFDAVAVAAEAFAEELDGCDELIVADVVGYVHKEVADGEQMQSTAMVFDFVRSEAQRGLVFQRLSEHVRRQRHREDDVNDLFN